MRARVPVGSAMCVGASSSSLRCCVVASAARAARRSSGTRVEVRAARDAVEERLEPGEVGAPAPRARNRANRRDRRAPSLRTNSLRADEVAAVVVPRQRVEPERPHALEHGGGARAGAAPRCSGFSSTSSSSRRITRRATTASVRASHATSSRAHELRRAKYSSRSLRVERRRELDLRLALAVVEIDRDDELLARDRLRARERRAAAVRELVARLRAGPAPRDAVGIREP